MHVFSALRQCLIKGLGRGLQSYSMFSISLIAILSSMLPAYAVLGAEAEAVAVKGSLVLVTYAEFK